ncbi:conjugation system SOS inhibitor PsiB [Citrobacter portucalensis]|uniref:conjugation system SOS inhibitor PsiB n=1 Tax=Citrobacter portucalensis TaxID=1639133 RepID=UPI004042BDDE
MLLSPGNLQGCRSRRAVVVCSHKRRLILNKGLTLSALIAMTPEDYEQFRSDGWSSRKVLTQAVLRELLLPEGWVVSPENHTEYGGVWPVSLRYVPPHGRHWFMLTSPGEVCDHWMLLLQSASGQRIKCLLRMPVLDTFLINSLLLRADVLDKKRYTLAGLANELAGITVAAISGRRP